MTYDVIMHIFNISIHAPSRERHIILKKPIKFTEFQSTLPRGSDSAVVMASEYSNISIHAPSRERLQTVDQYEQKQKISIHAPSRERPREAAREALYNDISIHAPSRERLDWR